MKKKKNTKKIAKLISVLLLTTFLIFFVLNFGTLLKLPSKTFIVKNGTLSFEETSTGYIIRDEVVLKGEEYKNGIVQIKSEGEKVSKGETVFRYYSNGEDKLLKQINQLDSEINEILSKSENKIKSSDISSIDKQIEKNLKLIYNENEIEKIEEYNKQIEYYMTKKSQIAGEQSVAGTHLKELIEQRNVLKEKITSEATNIVSSAPGIVSYRVDGLENILTINDLSYLNKELLESYELNVGAIIPQSIEEGKIVNNFFCYIACVINTENAMEAKEGDLVTLRLSNTKEVNAQIEKIIEEEKNRVVVFKITKQVENLLEYRKVSLDIIWWQYEGLKISNNAIIEKNDLSYVQRKRTNYVDDILVKVLRQNDTFSIVTNYTTEELKELGYSEKEITDMKKIKIYDEILLH